jgi:hypothetical protein
LVKSGADRDRTGDPLLAKQVLSQLSYRPEGATKLQVSRFRSAPQVGRVQRCVQECRAFMLSFPATFINVPTILQFDDIPLVSVVREEALGFTTEIPIYHSDGTYLAKVRGTRVYATEQGKKVGVDIKQFPGSGFAQSRAEPRSRSIKARAIRFATQAELFTPDGYFVRVADAPKPELFNATGEALEVGGFTLEGNVFQGCRIGVWLRSDGSLAIGVA